MSHRSRHDRRSIRASWLRLAAALSVMLLAVLPHATLAAGAGEHASATTPSADAPALHGSMAPAAEPCHESGKPSGASHGAMPSCCILGCGLIASIGGLTAQIVPAGWEIVPPVLTDPGDDRPPEPAERPPRALFTFA